jgi:AcrR family transcriptional regulator
VPPKSTGNTRPRASSRDAILVAFATLVSERGYADASLSDVAAAVKVSKGTIVHHFGTKDQMLSELMERYMERRLADLRRLENEFETPLEQFVAAIFSLVAIHETDPAASRGFMREFTLFATSKEMKDVRLMRREYQTKLTAIVEQGMSSGLLRREDIDLVTLQIFGMCNYAWTWFRPGERWSVREVAGTFVAVVLQGLVAENTDSQTLRAEIESIMERAERVLGAS